MVRIPKLDNLTEQPLVSIGVPTYYGEQTINRALDSLISQTYTNLEIIISDDNSTDRTIEICNEYKNKDSRLSLHCNSHRVGAVNNFNRTLQLSKGEFFFWNAQDDYRHASYIEKCVARFLADDTLVYCHSRYSDEVSGNKHSAKTHSISEIVSDDDACRRFYSAYKSFIGSTAFYGMYRRSQLGSKLLWQDFIASECCIFNACLLEGGIDEIEEILFFYSGREQVRSIAEHYSFLSHTAKGSTFFSPYSRYVYESLKTILSSSLTTWPKIKLGLILIRYEALNVPTKLIFRGLRELFGASVSNKFASAVNRCDLIPMQVGHRDKRN